MRVAAVVVVIVSLVLVSEEGSLGQRTSAESTESYAIYSILIPQLREQPQTKYVIANQTVPSAITTRKSRIDPSIVTTNEFERQLRIWKANQQERDAVSGQPCISPPEEASKAETSGFWSAMADYLRKNAGPTKLDRKFDLPSPYAVLEVTGFDSSGGPKFGANEGSDGVYEVSAVGFNADMTIAVVHAGFDLVLGGRSAVCAFQKTNGQWHEIESGCRWRS